MKSGHFYEPLRDRDAHGMGTILTRKAGFSNGGEDAIGLAPGKRRSRATGGERGFTHKKALPRRRRGPKVRQARTK